MVANGILDFLTSWLGFPLHGSVLLLNFYPLLANTCQEDKEGI